MLGKVIFSLEKGKLCANSVLNKIFCKVQKFPIFPRIAPRSQMRGILEGVTI